MASALVEVVAHVTDGVDSSERAGRPDPVTVHTPAEFVEALRRLQRWTGRSSRELEKRAKAIGHVLPRSTFTAALARHTLPREELILAFVLACECSDDEARSWLAARRRIAAAPDPGRPTPDAAPTVAGTAAAMNPSAAPADAAPTDAAPDDAVPADRMLIGTASPAVRRRRRVGTLAAVLVAVTVLAVVTDRFFTDPPDSAPPGPIPPPAAELNDPPPAPAGAPKVLYVGDSIAMETHNALASLVNVTGKAGVVPAHYPSTTICDYLADRTEESSVPSEHKLPALVKSERPLVVVLQFWGEARTPCTQGTLPASDDYYRRYRQDADRAVQQIVQAAQEAAVLRPKLVWVLQGPDRDTPDRIRRLNVEVFSAVANANSDLTSDAGWHVSLAAYPYETVPDGRYMWRQFLPCTDDERQNGYCTEADAYGGVTKLHKGSDSIHFCLGAMIGTPPSCDTKSPGIVRYGTAIANTVTEYLGI